MKFFKPIFFMILSRNQGEISTMNGFLFQGAKNIVPLLLATVCAVSGAVLSGMSKMWKTLFFHQPLSEPENGLLYVYWTTIEIRIWTSFFDHNFEICKKDAWTGSKSSNCESKSLHYHFRRIQYTFSKHINCCLHGLKKVFNKLGTSTDKRARWKDVKTDCGPSTGIELNFWADLATGNCQLVTGNW